MCGRSDLGGLSSEQQVSGCDLIVLHFGQRLLDLLHIVAHSHHHIWNQNKRDVSLSERYIFYTRSGINKRPLTEHQRERTKTWCTSVLRVCQKAYIK